MEIKTKPYWLGKKRPPFSAEWKENMRKGKARQKTRDGYINSPEARAKLSKTLTGKPKPEWVREKMRGENSRFWRGGRSSEMRTARERADYKEWRLRVFKRDNYSCVQCGYKSKGTRPADIQADHKIPFCVLPIYMRFDMENSRTLCISCHRKTWSYGKGAREFREKLEKVYSSREASKLPEGSSSTSCIDRVYAA